MRLALVLAATVLATAAHAETLNLLCKGSQTLSSLRGEEVEPYEVEFRIDTERGLWCGGDCQRTSRLVDVLPDRYVLWDTDERNALVGEETNRGEINRQSGKLSARSRTTKLLVSAVTEAQCERRPFKPFPTANF